MARKYCPHCAAARNMQVTTSRREEADDEGRVRVIVTRALHCETCGAFLRAEDEAEDAARPGTA